LLNSNSGTQEIKQSVNCLPSVLDASKYKKSTG